MTALVVVVAAISSYLLGRRHGTRRTLEQLRGSYRGPWSPT